MKSKSVKKPLNERPNFSSKSNFKLQEVIGSLSIQDPTKPFKRLKFESTEELNLSDLEFSEEFSGIIDSAKENISPYPVQDVIITKNFQKSRNIQNLEKYSTIFTISSESLKLNDDVYGIERHTIKRDLNADERESPEYNEKEYLGFLPGKRFCKNCNCEVNTVIRLEMPKIPFWKRICCSNCEVDTFDRFQRVLHLCSLCHKVVCIVTPSLY